MNKSIDKIVIVGGGSAGWSCAAYLAKRFQCDKPGAVKITLIESQDVATIGVGEATIPTIRGTLRYLGIDERRFMLKTSATFKQAIRFDDWLHLPTAQERSSFYHAFQAPSKIQGTRVNSEIAPYWIMSRDRHQKSFTDYSMIQGQVCEAGLGPKNAGDKMPPFGLVFAYHLDASKYGDLLKEYSTNRGVVHQVGHVTDVASNEDGSISHLHVKNQGILKADFFIDCTGFAAHLIEKTLGAPFTDQTWSLFCDRAVTVQIPYRNPDEPIRPFTTSTAKENGWIWDIGLENRRGLGYVYSSRHSSDARAEEILRDYAGDITVGQSVRSLKMRVGYRKTQWVKNCLAVGLSAGFVEPLESTGLHQVDLSMRSFADLFTRRGDLRFSADEYNRQMSEWFRETFDFIKFHYCLTRRSDTEFWIENCLPETISQRLTHLLEVWKTRPTTQWDILTKRSTWTPDSYHEVLFGMDHIPDLKGEEYQFPDAEKASTIASNNESNLNSVLRALPKHRDLINQIYASARKAM